MDLAILNDPQGRVLIDRPPRRVSLHEGELFPETVGDLYEAGGEILDPLAPWLEDYREDSPEQKESEERLARMPQVEFPSVTNYPSFEPVSRTQALPLSSRSNPSETRPRESAATTRAGAAAARSTRSATWEKTRRADLNRGGVPQRDNVPTAIR